MKVDLWLTSPADIADWARGDRTRASCCMEGQYDHMTSQGWVKLGSSEVCLEELHFPANAQAEAARALEEELRTIQAVFEARCTEIRAQIDALLAIEG